MSRLRRLQETVGQSARSPLMEAKPPLVKPTTGGKKGSKNFVQMALRLHELLDAAAAQALQISIQARRQVETKDELDGDKWEKIDERAVRFGNDISALDRKIQGRTGFDTGK